MPEPVLSTSMDVLIDFYLLRPPCHNQGENTPPQKQTKSGDVRGKQRTDLPDPTEPRASNSNTVKAIPHCLDQSFPTRKPNPT
ncbi:hypothetical protein VTJ04DRAFT_4491 [Mycothermus thermophilus]|uniref:uncharacterized protein n=1 Tax=Humicola insolens TaxID=85995 RepID=UPI0037429A90